MKNTISLIIPLMLGTLMAGIDSSIVNVSLPTMSREFGVNVDEIEWVITIYMLGFCIFMPLTNWLRLRIGFYKLYLGSLLLFILGSLGCALSTTLPELITARAFQAFGGGSLSPTAMAILTTVFPANERGKVMGWWSLGGITGPAIGPTLGGLLTEYFGWTSIFYINLPIGILAIALAMRSLKFLDRSRDTSIHFDLSGFALFTLFILLFQFAIAQFSSQGFGSLQVWLPLVLSLVALGVFIKRSYHRPGALFDLSIFERPTYVYCVLITVLRSIALFGGLFLLPFLLQGYLKFSELESGLMILPNSIMMAIFTPLAGNLSDKYGPKRFVMAGLGLVALSMFLFSQINEPMVWYVLLSMMIRGIGLGLLITPLTATAMNAVLPNQVTPASSVYTLIQQLSGSIGIAFSGMIQQFIYQYYISRNTSEMLSEHYSIQYVFMISGSLVALGIFIATKLPRYKAKLPQNNEQLSVNP
ncbi:MDR family MFS transporter [Siphonobacter curvatus]|uniref:MFS transporter n=1 Tax=Siphonobacter curvatus TaxID=2094562 RepID=A0A2S7IQL2_9BACT|nr:MDR family MFS transporter [Siphonobacter curvatus]PQA59972.1 MFS transporter [Siphonobacter curvatus]